jgi:hypothetical protein
MIKLSELKTTPNCSDDVGRVYFYKNTVFRGINDEYVLDMLNLFSSGLFKELIDANLIPETTISNHLIEGYQLVIESEKIENWTYSYEWSFEMLKEAALTILKINNIANKYGYQLKDPHQENITFKFNRPLYIDIGSLVKIKTDVWIGYKEFLATIYLPLKLMQRSLDETGRSILRMEKSLDDREVFILLHPVFGTLSFITNSYMKIYTFFFRFSCISSFRMDGLRFSIALKLLQKIISYLINFFINIRLTNIANMKVCKRDTRWGNYQSEIDVKNNFRFNRIVEIISSLNDTSSLIEIAANQGLFANYLLNNTHLSRVIATDYDVAAVDYMFKENSKNVKLLSLVLDIVRPHGVGSRKPAYDRLKSDIVLALAVTHHLILSQNIDLNYIFFNLKKFTNKYILVEFMPKGLSDNVNQNLDVPIFYNEAWFLDEFKKHFEFISCEKLEDNRILYLGKI